MKRFGKVLSALLVLIFLLGLFPPGALQTASAFNPYTDVNGHWAAGSINRWNSLGYLDPEFFAGTRFYPDRFITRAEFFSLLVNSLGATARADISEFSDVTGLPAASYDVVSVAKQMGIANGYTDGTMRPNSNILRQEAATLVARAMGMSSVADWTLSRFHDSAFVSAYAVTYMAALVDKGIMSGYPDGSIRPSAFITRAEAVRILDNLFNNVYMPESGLRNVYLRGGLLVNTPGAELRDAVIDGDVIIGDGVGSGNVVFSDCTINGRVIVRGGGPNSVTLSNTVVAEGLYVASYSADTRIAVTDNSTVPVLEAVSDFTLSGSGVSAVTILENARRNAIVNLNGVSLDDLSINGPGAQVLLNSGHAINARFDDAGQGASLNLADNTSVGHLTISSPNITVTGKGAIRNLIINNSGANVLPDPEFLTLGLNIIATVAGQSVSSIESQWANNNVDRVSADSPLRVDMLTNTSAFAPFDQATLHLIMVAGGTASEAHVTQAAASRIPLTQRNNRWGYWVGFFVPAPPDAGNMASVTYTYTDGEPITIPPKTLDTLNGRRGMLIYLPVFREPGRETGLVKELLQINWGGHLTENIHFLSSTLHLAPLTTAQRNSLQSDFDNRIMYSIQPGAAPYTGAEATRRILNSDNPLGLPSRDNRAIDAMNRALSSTEARGILEDTEFASDLNIDTTGNSQYSRLSDAGKQYVAEQVLAARRTAFTTPTAVKAAFDRAVQTRLAAETTLLGQINSSADYSALRRIIEASANAAILQFQTGADPYKSYTASQKDRMADYLWRLRTYRSIQEVIDAIKRYLGDPANAPGVGDSTDIRDMAIQRMTVAVSPNSTTLAFGQTRTLTITVELSGGGFLSPAQVGSLIDQGVITLKWDNADAGALQGAVGVLSRSSTQPNVFIFTCTNRGLDTRNRTDRLTLTLTDANNRRFTATVSFTAAQYIAATGITRIIPDQVALFLDNNVPVQLEAVLTPANTTEAPTWSISPAGIANISSTGVVTGISPGVATVTARIIGDGNPNNPINYKTCQVRVFRDADDVVVDPGTVILTPGGSVTVTAYTATPGRQVIWTVGDYVTVMQSGYNATITASRSIPASEPMPISTKATVRTVGSERSADVKVEIREDTGITARLRDGSIMYAGETNYVLTNVTDEAMMTQMLYVQVEQTVPSGIAPAAWYVGGRNPVRVGDPIEIRASDTGIGMARIRLYTDSNFQGDYVAELYIIIAPMSEAVTFSHTGTTGTWYPGTTAAGTGQRTPAGDIRVDPTYGRVLEMQLGDRPSVTPRTSQGTLRNMAWSAYISNQYREILYLVPTDISVNGMILDKNNQPIPNPNPANGYGSPNLLFSNVFVSDGGPYGGTPGNPAGYEFHTPQDTGASRLGFFRHDLPDAVRLAVLRGGSLERVTTNLLTATNGNLIPNNTQPTGLAAVVMASPRSAMSAEAFKVWGDLYYTETADLFIAELSASGTPTGRMIFNPEISAQSGFILWEWDGGSGKWIKSTRDMYTDPLVTEQSVRDGLIRITDVNGTEDPNENGLFGQVNAIMIGDPNFDTNAFYVRVLPDPVNRPDAYKAVTVPWKQPVGAYPPITSDNHHIGEVIIRPGSEDMYDFIGPAETPGRQLDYPYMEANFATGGETDIGSMVVSSLDGITFFIYFRTPYAADEPVSSKVYEYRYSVSQWSKLGFAPLPGTVGIGPGGGRQPSVRSTTYSPQYLDPLQYVLTITPPPGSDIIIPMNIEIGSTVNPFDDNLVLNEAVRLGIVTAPPYSITAASVTGPFLPPGVTILADISVNATTHLVSAPLTSVIGRQGDIYIAENGNPDNKIIVRFTVVAAGITGGSAPFTPGSILLEEGPEQISGGPEPIMGISAFMETPALPQTPPLTAVSLRLNANVATGGTTTLVPFVTPYNADKSLLTWSSSNEAVATVAGGVVSGVSAGSAVITVTGGGVNAACTVSVRADARPVTSVGMSRTTLPLNVGAAYTLSVNYRPTNATFKTASWMSNNQSVARVEPNGRVVGVSAGTAVITAISDSGARVATCTVTVVVPVESVTLAETRITLRIGETYQLIPIINPTDATNTAATYTTRSATIAYVSSYGLITARRAGTTTITVRVDGKTVTCTVTVIR